MQLPQRENSFGFTALGVFLFFGTLMAALAGFTLLVPGTLLDSIWRLNPRALAKLAPLGRRIGLPFLLLSLLLAVSGYLWFRRAIWGWRLAVAIVGIQVIANVVNLGLGRMLEGSTGLVLSSALLLYLLRARTRSAFL